MSLDPFAQLEADVNDAVMRTMANTTISINGAQDIPAIVEAGMNDRTHELPGPGGYAPTATVQASAIPADPRNLPVVIRSGTCAGAYKLSDIDPDGTGLAILYLNKP